MSRQQFSIIIQPQYIPPHVSSDTSPAISQSNTVIVINGHTPFRYFKDFLSFDIKSNVRWGGYRGLRDLYKSLDSDSFPRFRNLLRNNISKKNRTVLPIMVQLQFVQSAYVHGRFIPQLSDCKTLRKGSTIIQDELSSVSFRLDIPSVRYVVFGIYWEPYLQYKTRRVFFFMRCEEDGRGFSRW